MHYPQNPCRDALPAPAYKSTRLRSTTLFFSAPANLLRNHLRWNLAPLGTTSTTTTIRSSRAPVMAQLSQDDAPDNFDLRNVKFSSSELWFKILFSLDEFRKRASYHDTIDVVSHEWPRIFVMSATSSRVPTQQHTQPPLFPPSVTPSDPIHKLLRPKWHFDKRDMKRTWPNEKATDLQLPPPPAYMGNGPRVWGGLKT